MKLSENSHVSLSVSAVAGFNSNFRLPGTRKDTVSNNVKSNTIKLLTTHNLLSASS